MKRTLTAVALATAMLTGSAIAQAPSPGPPPSAPVSMPSVKITAEQAYVIKENVKDVRPVASPGKLEIGGKAPANVELHDFPALVAEKVSAVKTYKFFIADNQVVVVDPHGEKIADILK